MAPAPPAETDVAYAQLVSRLISARRFGVDLGLERVTRVLEGLGRPQDRFGLVVQIGGTNGKGSTVECVASILRAAGVSIGVFTSPHLLRLTQRFVVGDREATRAELLAVEQAVAKVEQQMNIDLTFFEKLTVMAVQLFANAGVEVCILEVGLGGRLDSTTAVGSRVCAVTGVAFDHCDYLGDSLEAIAQEKAGIFRPRQHIVLGCSGLPEGVRLLRGHAEAMPGARVVVVDSSQAYEGPMAMVGEHQRRNAACALAVIDGVEKALGVTITHDQRRDGLTRARVAGRMQVVAEDPRVVVDAAHNPHAAQALAEAIRREGMPGPRVVLLGVSAGKDARGIAGALAEVADHMVACQSSNPRAMACGDLADRCREWIDHAESDIERALAWARDSVGPSGTVIAAGSLFFAGDVVRVCTGEPADPGLLSDPV